MVPPRLKLATQLYRTGELASYSPANNNVNRTRPRLQASQNGEENFKNPIADSARQCQQHPLQADQIKRDEVERHLTVEIERLLPDFARSSRGSEDVVIIHQDSFAADYQDEEYALFGKAMKFAGIYGKEIRVIGKNRETLNTANAAILQ